MTWTLATPRPHPPAHRTAAPLQPAAPSPSPRRRSFEQGDWLAELELLQLAQELKALADQRGGFEAELFDLMLSIADVLELDHGWQRSQSNQWLVRMGLWEEDLSGEA